jgi:universal stress protein E
MRVNRLKNILVAVDFSPCSAAALGQAVRLAKVNGAQVTAMNVVPVPVYAVPDSVFIPLEFPSPATLLTEARRRWSAWPPGTEAGAGVSFETELGSPRSVLLDRSRLGPADLLVIGAHGDLDAKRGIGSTAAACVQRAECPVLVVREGRKGPFRSVVACVDFSETSRLALQHAIRVAAIDGADLHILHAYEDPWHGFGPPEGVRDHMPDFAGKYRHAIETHLKAFCQPQAHEIGALKAKFHAVLSQGHGKGIVDFVAQEKCDLIVLGTRNSWNARDFLLGSTAERVVRDASCSALTIKPVGFGKG